LQWLALEGPRWRPELSAANPCESSELTAQKLRFERPRMNEAAPENSATGFNRRILVVDDNQAIHEDFRKILCGAGADSSSLDETEAELFGDTQVQTRTLFELEFASQGEEALKKVRESIAAGQPYAMAFMDVRMPPGWDGIETTARIWQVDPDLLIVFCTAYSDYSVEKMSSRLQHTNNFVILKKPFDIVEVMQLAIAFTERWNLGRGAEERTRHLQESEKALRQSGLSLEKRVAERTEELAAAQSRIKYLLHSSPALIYCIKPGPQPEFTFISDNVVTVLGYEPKELLSSFQFWGERLHPEDAARAIAHRALVQEKVLPPIEYRFRNKDGSYRWIHDDARIVRDAAGRPIEIIGSCIDITLFKQAEHERQRMEVQLRQAHKLEAIGQLAAGIAHEINTPIQYVGDNTRFLKDSFHNIGQVLKSHKELIQAAKEKSLTPDLIARAEKVLADGDLDYLFEQIPAAIKESLEGVERVARIVRAMKEFSHPGGKEKTAVDLNKAIESTVTVARNEWKYVADVKLDLDPRLPAIPCFIGEFNQAILNLLVNAAHAIGDVVKQAPGSKGVITVSTRADGDWVDVRVRDTGAGISESNRARIFEPFFTTKEVGKGTGQGLSIVYGSIVKRHGGTVNFETEPGKGTTFILRLPIAPAVGDTELRKAGNTAVDPKSRTGFAPYASP
jgi:two-component system, NtrC family, sensor kinase